MESVLALKPSIAVFDCDGTLWRGDAGADFFYWEMKRCLVTSEVAERLRRRYEQYRTGEVSEEQMCGDMVTMNCGIPHQELVQAAKEFFAEVTAHRIFPEMQELTRRLAEQQCTLWAVSSTNSWVVEAGAQHFGIPPGRILAACVHVEDGNASDRLIRVPTDELKAVAIREVIGRAVDAVFGNSIHDLAMLEMARHPFCINPNPDLAKTAEERGWPVYWPENQ